MIDLPTTKDMSHPHHRRAVGALVAAGIIFILLLAAYYLRQKASAPVSNPADNTPALQALVSQPNPPSGLTAAEIKKRQALVRKN